MKNVKPRLTGVYLENFQSIRNPTYLNLEKLTFLYGPNSAGKSSIIDALKLLEYVSGKKATESNLYYLFRKNNFGSESTTIGIEFLAGTLNYQNDPEIDKWSNVPDSIGEHNHYEFHTELIGNRVQVEFSEDCESLKIIMRSIFLQHAANQPKQISQQITELNQLVLDYCIFHVYSEAQGYIKYLTDVSTLAVPLAAPVMASQNDKRNYRMPTWF